MNGIFSILARLMTRRMVSWGMRKGTDAIVRRGSGIAASKTAAKGTGKGMSKGAGGATKGQRDARAAVKKARLAARIGRRG